MIDDERELVRRCLAHDEAAYADFVERFRRLIFGVCLRMLCDRQEAEDAAQEVFVRAIRSLDRWDRDRPLRPWLLTIASNLCRTYLSKRKRRPGGLELAEEVPDLRQAERPGEEFAATIAEALGLLRDDYRQAFLLYHEQGMSYQEMSDATGKPVGTLKTWLHRARNEMLEFLKSKGVVPESWHDVSGV